MNTKQVEEITGLSRQNIRYYERMGLLHPSRETDNSYRDYSTEDVACLKMIKMLRMLDMSIEEISQVIHKEVSLEEAVKSQKEILSSQQKQLRAAIEMCDKIEKTQLSPQNVEDYLTEMEYLQNREGGFAQFRNDYKQVAEASKQRQFSFQVHRALYREEEIWKEIQNYGEENGLSVIRVKNAHPLRISVEGIEYDVRSMKIRQNHQELSTAIICTMERPEKAPDARIPHGRKRVLQILYEVMRDVNRQRGKSLLTIAVCAMVVCFMAIYMGNVSSHKQQLEALPKTYRIAGEIKNASGELSSGLIIPEKLTNAVRTSSYVKSYSESIDLSAVLTMQDKKGQKATVRGVEPLEAMASQQEGPITWETGIDRADFVREKNVCVMDELYMEGSHLSIGDTIAADVSYYFVETGGEAMLQSKPLEPVELKIIGSGNFAQTNIICPLNEVKEWFDHQKVPYQASAVSFMLTNPEKLDSFKKEMEKAGFTEVNGKSKQSYKGTSLVLEDLDYIAAASQLRKNIDFFSGFYPVLLILILVMGYIISYLLLQSRRLELAIMKSLGSGNTLIMVQIFLEHLLLALTGALLGMGISMLFGLENGVQLISIIGMFLLCFGIGSMVSLGIIKRLGVMAVLAGKE